MGILQNVVRTKRQEIASQLEICGQVKKISQDGLWMISRTTLQIEGLALGIFLLMNCVIVDGDISHSPITREFSKKPYRVVDAREFPWQPKLEHILGSGAR